MQEIRALVFEWGVGFKHSLPYDYDETIVRVNYVQKNSKLVPMGFSHVKLC